MNARFGSSGIAIHSICEALVSESIISLLHGLMSCGSGIGRSLLL
jgi:hypothetical protein